MKDAVIGRASLLLGQNIYTPADTTSYQLVAEDRPYAGWLYFGFGFAANQGSRRYDKLELEIGVVGPLSFAEEVQTFWHSLFGLDFDVIPYWGTALFSLTNRTCGVGKFLSHSFASPVSLRPVWTHSNSPAAIRSSRASLKSHLLL